MQEFEALYLAYRDLRIYVQSAEESDRRDSALKSIEAMGHILLKLGTSVGYFVKP